MTPDASDTITASTDLSMTVVFQGLKITKIHKANVEGNEGSCKEWTMEKDHYKARQMKVAEGRRTRGCNRRSQH